MQWCIYIPSNINRSSDHNQKGQKACTGDFFDHFAETNVLKQILWIYPLHYLFTDDKTPVNLFVGYCNICIQYITENACAKFVDWNWNTKANMQILRL